MSSHVRTGDLRPSWHEAVSGNSRLSCAAEFPQVSIDLVLSVGVPWHRDLPRRGAMDVSRSACQPCRPTQPNQRRLTVAQLPEPLRRGYRDQTDRQTDAISSSRRSGADTPELLVAPSRCSFAKPTAAAVKTIVRAIETAIGCGTAGSPERHMSDTAVLRLIWPTVGGAHRGKSASVHGVARALGTGEGGRPRDLSPMVPWCRFRGCARWGARHEEVRMDRSPQGPARVGGVRRLCDEQAHRRIRELQTQHLDRAQPVARQ